MRSSPRLALARRSILLLPLLLIAACAHTTPTPVILDALRCAPLIPDSYRQPIKGAPLPPQPLTVGALGVALDSQTARLDQANGRAADVIAITEACDKRSAEVKAALEAKPTLWARMKFW